MNASANGFTVLQSGWVRPPGEHERERLAAAGARLVVRHCPTEEELIEHGREVDALITLDEPCSARVIAALERCRVISRLGVGVDRVDLPAAASAGIIVANVPDFCVDEVSDHALMLLLALARRLPALIAHARAGGWDSIAAAGEVQRLRGQTLGLIGFGRIGRSLAGKTGALGLRLCAYDPKLDAATIRSGGAEPLDLPDLLAVSDFVSVHAPLTAETRGLLGAAELAMLRPSAFVINVARGALIDQSALVDALRREALAGAALDVLDPEPPDPSDPLLSMTNVIVTPHAAHYSVQAQEDVRRQAFENVARVLEGGETLHAVVA
ncbi:MAG: C-terminal binding protein [Solirubrobacteraceae bacterium]